jgi:nicotinamidase/pyrazinamidase
MSNQITMQLPLRTQIASFDVDAQYTFTPVCAGELPVAGGDEIAAELNAQAMFAALRVGSKDAHSVHAHWLASPDAPAFSAVAGPNMDIRWPAHAIVGTRGFDLLDTLPKPCDYNYFVWKGVEPDMHPYGACFHDLGGRLSTGVIEFLGARGIRTVLVGGLALDYCVVTTALQLAQASFNVIVNLAACRGIAEQSCTVALEKMRTAGILTIEYAAQLHSLKS